MERKLRDLYESRQEMMDDLASIVHLKHDRNYGLIIEEQERSIEEKTAAICAIEMDKNKIVASLNTSQGSWAAAADISKLRQPLPKTASLFTGRSLVLSAKQKEGLLSAAKSTNFGQTPKTDCLLYTSPSPRDS